MNKLETLQAALDARNEEVAGYQLNIDNYTRAISKIAAEYPDHEAMAAFSQQLASLLEEHKTEQLKAIIIREVIADQLAELEAP